MHPSSPNARSRALRLRLLRAYTVDSAAAIRCVVTIAIAMAAVFVPSLPASAQRNWVQMHAMTRIGVSFTSIAVDPTDPEHLALGTEEGSIVETFDGGITWSQQELEARLVAPRSLGPPSHIEDFSIGRPSASALGSGGSASLYFELDPGPPIEISRFPTRGTRLSTALPLPFYFRAYQVEFVDFLLIGRPFVLPNVLLADSASIRTSEPVRQIAICPEAEYPIIVASEAVLYGLVRATSAYSRLYALPRTTIGAVRCSGRVIAVATSEGLIVSRNGGIDFAPTQFGDPSTEPWAVSVDAQGRIVVALDQDVWVLDPRSHVVQSLPATSDSDAAPWSTVRSIAIAENGAVWIGVEDGLRVSRDGGETYSAVNRGQFYEQRVTSLATSGSHIEAVLETCNAAVCRGTRIVSSDDGGATWYESFEGHTRRRIREVASGPDGRAWVIAGGELWVSQRGSRASEVGHSHRARARDALRRTPPLAEVLERVLDETMLAPPRIADLLHRARVRNLLPALRANFWAFGYTEGGLLANGPIQWQRSWWNEGFYYFFYVDATFNWPDVGWTFFEGSRRTLYNVSRQVAFAVEDAWHERVLHLQHLAEETISAFEAEILLTRIEALECIIETWAQGPVFESPR